MLTWALCWLIKNLNGASEGIVILFFLSMVCDCAIFFFIACSFKGFPN